MPEDRIVVTAMGIVSALGIGRDEHLHALKNASSGLRYPELLETVHRNEFLLGEVRMSNEEMSERVGLDYEKNHDTRTALLAKIAIQDLLKDVDVEVLKESPLAFINASTVGGMSEVEKMYTQFVSTEDTSSINGFIDTLDCAESTGNVAKHFGLSPVIATISTACSSSANAIMLGARMIKMGAVEKAICGGADALSRFTLNGFNSLKNVDRSACRPFDQTRFGLNLGEGAAYLLLEKESAAKARGAKILAVLSGYSNTNDAYHPTAPSPDGSGALHTMENAIESAGIAKEDIGYINAHGTATINNDAAEGKAIQSLWDSAPPPFSSTKPFTGHTLAAAGSVEAIFSIIAMNEGMLIPNLNYSERMEELAIEPVTKVASRDIQHVLSNSFGFGGNNVTLIFSKA